MSAAIEQYVIETSWSTRVTDDIVNEALQGEIPPDMEANIYSNITKLNYGKVSNKDIFIKLFSILMKDDVNKPIQAIATQMGYAAGINDPARAFEWGIILIKNCRDSGLYFIKQIDEEWYVCSNFVLNDNVREKIDKLQYLPPMKTIPRDWTNNHDGGWMWENKHLILGKRPNQHDAPLAYDVINRLQSIPWEIDSATYLLEKETNKSMSRKKFLRVIDEYIGNPFYFVWRYDSRGRSYSSGYHINLQSNEYAKALLSLHNKEHIKNLSNLYIAIANHAGKDKLTWQERIDWVSNQPDVDNIPFKQPMLGRKAVRALKDTVEGKPSGYTMSLDATSSGLQIMAVISGCKQTARYVNCIDPTVRHDVYSEVQAMMNSHLKQPVLKDIVKQATMTHYYNSKATPKLVFSANELDTFYKTLNGLLPGAEAVMNTINACWNPKADAHSWVMPDNWMDAPLKTCYADQVQRLEQEKACLIKKLRQNTNAPEKVS